MKNNFVKELKWRGMVHDIMPGTEEQLNKGMAIGYVGFDPTHKSLTIGNMCTIMLLVHFQAAGHKPIALAGGATGRIGDPSGKDEERQLKDEAELEANLAANKKQLEKFLDFSKGGNGAELVDNYDWFKEFKYIDFLRDVGKHFPVSYMMAKDSVKNRLEKGISFTEFNYQVLQSYDYLWLYKNKGCTFQMGGSDQWGNMTAGAELIRRKANGEAWALTCPLITKADGSKFGKSESGNIWLDPEMTTPYQFYQFWMNASDEEAGKYIRIFTQLTKEEIEALEAEHAKAPEQRKLQQALVKDITIRVHSEDDYNTAIKASDILFGKATTDTLRSITEKELLAIFAGVPQVNIAKSELQAGLNVLDFVAEKTNIFPSKGEARRLIEGGGLSINKEKVDNSEKQVNTENLLNDKYILVQKGKKNYFLVTAG